MTYSEKYVGFYLAYTLPTAIFLLCPIVLFIGRHQYATSPPTGSVLGKSLRIWRLCLATAWSWSPAVFWKNLTTESFWDAAKPSNFRGEAKPNWMTFDDQWVDEVKRGFKACSVFLWYPIYCKHEYTAPVH